jgi:flagellar FliL protein
MSKPAKANEKATDKAGDKANPGEAAGKKSPKKLILIAAMLVVALGASGAGAWFFLGGKDKTKEAKHEPAPPPVFVNLEPFTVNLQPEEGEQYLQVTMVLQVKSEEAAESVKQHMPQVRSRLLMLLSNKKASEINSADGKHKLADEIVAQVKQPFSKDAAPQDVGSVFFTDLVIQ